jgi:hypothetical protein
VRESLSLIRTGEKMLIYIGTTNDTSGNPRRGWMRTTSAGQVLGWIEEGYEGRGAIAGYDDGESVKITVAPAEFKRLKRMSQEAEKANK